MEFIQKYTVNANEIRPRLWLGNWNSARDVEFHQNNKINVIYNCTKNLEFADSPTIERRYRIPIDDNLEEEEINNLSKWAPEAILYLLQEYRNGSTILVHCAAGMQRSAATVAMFLIATENLTPDQAIAEVKSRRPIAFFPSANFKKSIHAFHAFFHQNVAPTWTSNSIMKKNQ
jgi:dual specificity phosphatase 12